MSHRARLSLGIALALSFCLITGLTACREEEPTPIPPGALPQPATGIPLPSATPVPSDTPVPTETPDPAATSATQSRLPSDTEAVVVQFGRIENRPWRPEILAQMTPNFSLQANGYLVYRFAAGSSEDGWYQTVLTPTLVADFVKRLADDVKVLEMAEKLPPVTPSFATNLDGTPAGTQAYGIIYVKTASKEGRLILTQEQIEDPKGPYAANLKTLYSLIRALEFWRAATEASPSLAQRQAVAGIMGWWLDRRVPYSPAGALAFGTRARSWLPEDAVVSDWPLETDLAEAFGAPFGEPPLELALAEDEAPAVLRTERTRPPSFWGPLWRGADGQVYLVGIRPAIPGSNNVVIDEDEYTYAVPKRGMRAPGEATAEPEGDAEATEPPERSR